MKAVSLTVTALLLLALQPVRAADQPPYKVYLTNEAKADVPLQKPATDFSCNDKIYAVVEINRPGGDSGKHMLYATWRNPAGEDQEETKYEFETFEGQARLWVWLKLRASTEATIVKFLNPSAGMEAFVGQWELLLRIDDEQIAKKTFQVLC